MTPDHGGGATVSFAVEAEGLGKRFGDHEVLAGIDLQVPAGSVLGLLGPNGAGKTTIVRILATLLNPDAGRARVAGFDVVSQPQKVRQRIGLAGQYAAVDERLTGRENLRLIGRLYRLGKRGAAARADELLDRFDLLDAADRTAKTYSGACSGGWTWLPASSPSRRWCSSTSPRPGSTSAAGCCCGHGARAGGGRGDGRAHHAVPGGGRPARRRDRGHRLLRGPEERPGRPVPVTADVPAVALIPVSLGLAGARPGRPADHPPVRPSVIFGLAPRLYREATTGSAQERVLTSRLGRNCARAESVPQNVSFYGTSRVGNRSRPYDTFCSV